MPGPGGCAAGAGAATGREGLLTVVGEVATGPAGIGTFVGLGLAMGAVRFAFGGADAAGTGAVTTLVLTMGDKAVIALADNPALDNSATEA